MTLIASEPLLASPGNDQAEPLGQLQREECVEDRLHEGRRLPHLGRAHSEFLEERLDVHLCVLAPTCVRPATRAPAPLAAEARTRRRGRGGARRGLRLRSAPPGAANELRLQDGFHQ